MPVTKPNEKEDWQFSENAGDGRTCKSSGFGGLAAGEGGMQEKRGGWRAEPGRLPHGTTVHSEPYGWLGAKGSCQADCPDAVPKCSCDTVLLKNPLKLMLKRTGSLERNTETRK